jgi:hypothetical protein
MPRGTKLVLGDTSKSEHRVVRLANFHFDATDADLRSFFEGYDMVDWMRDTNVKSAKNTTACFLMGSMQEVFHVERELDAKELNGRPVRITRAKSGMTLTKEGPLNEREAEMKPSREQEAECGIEYELNVEANTTTVSNAPAPDPGDLYTKVTVHPDLTPTRAPSLTEPPLQVQSQSQRLSRDALCHGRQDVYVALELPWSSNGWNGPNLFAPEQNISTWDMKVAHGMLKPWNLVGKDNKDRTANMVTEKDWYYFQPKEVAVYMGGNLKLAQGRLVL